MYLEHISEQVTKLKLKKGIDNPVKYVVRVLKALLKSDLEETFWQKITSSCVATTIQIKYLHCKMHRSISRIRIQMQNTSLSFVLQEEL
jgi:hypothetical protein